MRHKVSTYRLNRDKAARDALMLNLASSLLEKGSITTTHAKARYVRPFVEKLITSAKKNRLNLKRKLASNLTGEAFKRLTMEIAPGFTKRNGGYTRIIKLGFRQGDSTPTAKIEFLEWEKSAQKAALKAPKPKKPLKPSSKKQTVKTVKKSKAK